MVPATVAGQQKTLATRFHEYHDAREVVDRRINEGRDLRPVCLLFLEDRLDLLVPVGLQLLQPFLVRRDDGERQITDRDRRMPSLHEPRERWIVFEMEELDELPQLSPLSDAGEDERSLGRQNVAERGRR